MRNSRPRRLYDYRFSGNSYKIRLALSHLGLDVEVVPVDILTGETQTQEFSRRNPMGQIPVLELADGTFLRESNAILFWLATGTKLMPETDQDKTLALQWMFFEQSNIDKVLGRARFLKAFPEFRTPAPQEWKEWYRVGNQALTVIDEHLTGNAFLVGGAYSIADIALYGYVHTADEGGFNLTDFPNVGRWLHEIEATDGYIPQMEGHYP